MNKKTVKVNYADEQLPVSVREWDEPDCYDLNVISDRMQMYGRETMQLAQKRGRVSIIANELFEMHHPDKADDSVAREKFVTPIVRQV
ncbi:hypothetical protein KDA14_04690, partial [Candidatus Saccharibacteria bacterium]|nr:hypothetical protein [Candidatus Saccharibacteria bacterium]